MDDKEPFLARWSRRKLETKEGQRVDVEKAAALHPDTEALADPAKPPVPERPSPGAPEYREYFDPQVDERLRHTALKRLFSEPQFNVMDGLDTYIDDYSKPDPIPEAMLRQLNQAKNLFLFDEEKQAGERASDTAPAAAVAATETAALPHSPPAGALDQTAAASTSTAPAPAAIATKNE
jgi:hypothetical protein